MTSTRPYDAVLLLSFGGPEGPDDVLPFLENVTAGRGIPRERLEQVAEHYHAFGGRSPINDQNRALLSALRAELERRGLAVPVAWGNRNWAPYVTDALRDLHDAGARRVVAVITSAYSSYSGCRQYREDLAAALTTLAAEGRRLQVDKIRTYFNHPGFVGPTVDAVLAALAAGSSGAGPTPRLLFVTHSIPTAMDAVSGPQGHAYVRQHLDVCESVVAGVQDSAQGPDQLEWELTYCSRSGPPSQPWLEPDVDDRLAELAEQGVRSVVLAPIGFVSDHMEVVYDLDTQAAATANRLGIAVQRAATVGTDARFVSGLVDLVLERAALARADVVDQPTTGSLGPWPAACPPMCCRNLRAAKPAACGADAPQLSASVM